MRLILILIEKNGGFSPKSVWIESLNDRYNTNERGSFHYVYNYPGKAILGGTFFSTVSVPRNEPMPLNLFGQELSTTIYYVSFASAEDNERIWFMEIRTAAKRFIGVKDPTPVGLSLRMVNCNE